ncbi:DDE family transposase [Heliophilum fasciatum]|uniref:DDE family transposase n=1 Tax=Heliophilum fasciatum TaxID=35700 RepID=A0A4R2RKF9_9FIRM|nr:hypothetical protein [Heliophilum fasciatum]TCP59705.1 DDE family transposase [Heliophilum fasciatum]
MYKKPSPQMTIDDFILPFSGKLSAENRWVQLARIIPWDEIGKHYAFMFPERIYHNRENLAYCKARGIRLSGPRLGRPPANRLLKKTEKQIEKLDARQRNAVKGKFGEGNASTALLALWHD